MRLPTPCLVTLPLPLITVTKALVVLALPVSKTRLPPPVMLMLAAAEPLMLSLATKVSVLALLQLRFEVTLMLPALLAAVPLLVVVTVMLVLLNAFDKVTLLMFDVVLDEFGEKVLLALVLLVSKPLTMVISAGSSNHSPVAPLGACVDT